MSNEPAFQQHSIGKEAALALLETEWWKGKRPVEVARIQMFLAELAMPFGEFHAALASVVGEFLDLSFATNAELLAKALLKHCERPTREEIIALLPESKREMAL